MKFPALTALLALFPLAAAVSAAEENPPAAPKPSMLDRVLHPFGGGKAKEKEAEAKPSRFKHLDLTMVLDPKLVKPSEIRQFKVIITLVNKGKQLAQLEFPTSQRIEVIVKTKSGKLVETWSEDQSFVSDPSLVAINPGERVEYIANLSTRDLAVGEKYVVEAFFPNFEALRAELPLAPVK